MGHLRTTLGIVLSACVLSVACGSTDDDGSGKHDNVNGLFADGGGIGNNNGTNVGVVGGVTPGSACATSNAGTSRPPARLVFVYDRSLSMDDNVGSTTKWDACKAGVANFFASPSSAGIHASLTFF